MCKKCGRCCKTLTTRVDIVGYSEDQIEEIRHYFIQFGCSVHRTEQELIALVPKVCINYINGECAIYELRPMICRRYECNQCKD